VNLPTFHLKKYYLPCQERLHRDGRGAGPGFSIGSALFMPDEMLNFFIEINRRPCRGLRQKVTWLEPGATFFLLWVFRSWLVSIIKGKGMRDLLY
jgi:hypothetical protein